MKEDTRYPLETLCQTLELDCLSDIRLPQNLARLPALLAVIAAQEYCFHAWAETLQYITGRASAASDAAALRQELVDFCVAQQDLSGQ